MRFGAASFCGAEGGPAPQQTNRHLNKQESPAFNAGQRSLGDVFGLLELLQTANNNLVSFHPVTNLCEVSFDG